jgi:transposase
MGHIIGEDRNQAVLFPEAIDDYINENNPVRFIDAFVNSLDLEQAGFNHVTPSPIGRNRYSTNDLLKLYVYGYFNKIRSSRKLQMECGRNVELMWLLCKLVPDFRTIADFRKNNAKAMKNVFKAFVRVCLELDLYSKELIAIDGSKFRAANSKSNNVTLSKLKDKLKRIDEHINEYMHELAECDEIEADEATENDIKQKLILIEQKKELYNSFLREMKDAGDTQKSFTDPDSRLMRVHNGGYDVCYNVQTAVDSGNHLIVDFEATNSCNDTGLLFEYAQRAKQELDIEVLELVADCGYEKHEDIWNCLKSGIIPHVSLKNDLEAVEIIIPYVPVDVTPELRHSAKPEDIEKVLASGVLPKLFEEQDIEITVIEEFAYGLSDKCFVLNEPEGTLTCPEGKILNKAAYLAKKKMTRYTSRSACHNCTNKCTTAKFKQVDFSEGQTMHCLKGNSLHKSKVKIRIKPNKEKLKKRKTIVEHPFGTIKRWCDGSYLLMRGITKANADLSLSFLAYNMKRAINIVGVRKLLDHMV